MLLGAGGNLSDQNPKIFLRGVLEYLIRSGICSSRFLNWGMTILLVSDEGKKRRQAAFQGAMCNEWFYRGRKFSGVGRRGIKGIS
ncbi:MAG TPA: hypothetical protein DD706_11470 [Nitrospiraceae bacterium]|nr:hypothetical protein [Nitrospiraceae bacterium]